MSAGRSSRCSRCSQPRYGFMLAENGTSGTVVGRDDAARVVAEELRRHGAIARVFVEDVLVGLAARCRCAGGRSGWRAAPPFRGLGSVWPLGRADVATREPEAKKKEINTPRRGIGARAYRPGTGSGKTVKDALGPCRCPTRAGERAATRRFSGRSHQIGSHRRHRGRPRPSPSFTPPLQRWTNRPRPPPRRRPRASWCTPTSRAGSR